MIRFTACALSSTPDKYENRALHHEDPHDPVEIGYGGASSQLSEYKEILKWQRGLLCVSSLTERYSCHSKTCVYIKGNRPVSRTSILEDQAKESRTLSPTQYHCFSLEVSCRAASGCTSTRNRDPDSSLDSEV